MPKGLYELSAGFDNNNLLNLKIDTFERMNRIEQGISMPQAQSISMPEYEPFIPKDLDPDVIVTKQDERLPSLKDALDSPDPKIGRAAQDIVRQQALKNPVTYGVGTDQYVPYTPGQNKFTNDSFFKGKRNTMFGYNPYISLAENEQFNHDNVWNSYTDLGKVWRGTGLFVGRTLSKAVTGLVGMVGDVGAMAWNGLQELGDVMNINDGTKNNFWHDVSNNWLARKMEEADEHVKQEWFPTYKALNYDDKGAWEKLFDPYTWTNSFADGAGFLLQFAVPGAMLGKVGNAGRLARSIGALETELAAAKAVGDTVKATSLANTIAKAKNVSTFTKAMGYDVTGRGGKALQLLTGSDNVGGASAHIFNTMMESVAETKEGFKNTVEELMAKGMTEEEAIKIAGENAPGQFWTNAGILSISNAFENKFIQRAVGNRKYTNIDELAGSTLPKNLQSATSKTGRFFEANKWGNRINFYGKNYAKAAFFEGFWEENAQTAAARWARGEYERKGDDGGATEKSANTFLKQLWNQTQDAIKGNDREAADSIMAGAVIGVLGNTVFSKLAGTRGEIIGPDGTVIKAKTFLPEGQRKIELREKAQKTSRFINLRDAYLSISTFGAEAYNKDGTIDEVKAKEQTEIIREKLSKLNAEVGKGITVDMLSDESTRDQIQNQLFNNYVKAHILNDTGEALVGRLKDWNNKSETELAMYGVTPELAKNSDKWASRAEKLVQSYSDAKDLRYAAPAETLLDEYQNNTTAIRSIIYDYSAYRNNLQEKTAELTDKLNTDNPFSNTPEVQDYNQDHIRLLKLKQKLENENLDVIQRETIQKQIDDLEKKQKERKETIGSLGETITTAEGLLLPKDSNKLKESERLATYQDYFSNLADKVDTDVEIEKFNQLIKEYSNEATGYQKYLDNIDYWDKVYNEPANAKVNADIVDETIKTKEALQKQLVDLQEQLASTTTQDERDSLQAIIDDLKAQLGIIDEDTDTTDKDKDDKDIPDDIPPPDEKQYGTDEYVDQALAYITPFKTANKETIDAKDDKGERIWWKEIALEHSYDHDLTTFAIAYQTDLIKFNEKYDVFIIKDTIELLKERLSKAQLESFDENKFTLGAIVVFKEKGKEDFAQFKNGKTIAFSYNKEAFNYNYDERVKINASRTGRTTAETIEFFQEQQKIADTIRELVVANDSIIPIKIISGSLGVFPNTTAGNALQRFEGLYDTNNPVTIVKPENKNQIPGSLAGQLYLNIPEINTVNKQDAYIPVYMSTIQKGDSALQGKIYDSIQGIQYATFKTKEEAADVIKNYLFNFFYISEANNFRIKEVQGGFKIVYFDKAGEHTNWLNTPRLKLSDKIYNTEQGLSLYEKKDGTFQPTTRISREEYRNFIHNHLLTKRKVIVQNVKNAGEKLYTRPVNAYLNIEAFDSTDVQAGDAQQTTEQSIVDNFNALMDDVQPMAPPIPSKPTGSINVTGKVITLEGVPGSIDFTDNSKDTDIAKMMPEFANIFTTWDTKFANENLVNYNGQYLFSDHGRVFILVKVGNFIMPFYFSSKGTSGKAIDWHYVFGIDSKADWIIKGYVDPKTGEMEYSKQMQKRYPNAIAKLEQLKKDIRNKLPLDFERRDMIIKLLDRYNFGPKYNKHVTDIYQNLDVVNDIGNDGVDPNENYTYLVNASLALIQLDKIKENEIQPIAPSDAITVDEQKAIDALQGKTFDVLKPYTDVIQDANASSKDKKAALRGISDQMLASVGAEKAGTELGAKLGQLIDNLNYPKPIESKELKETAKVTESTYVPETTEQQLVNLKEQLERAKDGNMTTYIAVLTSKISQLEKQQALEAKPAEDLTPMERLRLLANEGSETPVASVIVPHIFEGVSYKIDFENDIIHGAFTETGKEFATEFYDSFSSAVYDKVTLNNNGSDYYFVKHKVLGKFVTFDNDINFYKMSELPQEIIDSKEFKYIENCN